MRRGRGDEQSRDVCVYKVELSGCAAAGARAGAAEYVCGAEKYATKRA